jgi:ubiquinone/menaquinone biosynthesis C-methylase UbiE
MSKNYAQFFYPEIKIGGFSNIDGSIIFYNRVNALLNSNSVVLDLGCGRGANVCDDPVSYRRYLRNFRGRCSKVIGVDIDSEASSNPSIDEFRLMKDNSFPIESGTVDVCVSDYVLEHIQDIDTYFAEIRRVLKPKGYICIRTTNLVSYTGIASSLVMNKYHPNVVAFVQGKDRKKNDVFPTVYACNTITKIRKKLKQNNFDYIVFGHDADPSYANFSMIIYFICIIYQKILPKCFGNIIMAFGQRID